MCIRDRKEAAEKAKIELSGMAQTSINQPYITADATGPKHLELTLTRAKFNELTADLVERTMGPVPVSYTHLYNSCVYTHIRKAVFLCSTNRLSQSWKKNCTS